MHFDHITFIRVCEIMKKNGLKATCSNRIKARTCGHGLPGALVCGGSGRSSRFTTPLQPWRIDVPMQSVPVSPPPMTTTFLPFADM